jgi:hypothetical protein
VHPSVRDMVIDLLLSNDAERQHFLRNSAAQGLALALSSAGGARGDRTRPLLKTDTDWQILTDRSIELVRSGSERDRATLLATFASGLQVEDAWNEDRVAVLAQQVLPHLADYWDDLGEPIALEQLRGFFAISLSLDPLPRSPSITSTWNHHVDSIERLSRSGVEVIDPTDTHGWFELIALLEENEPRVLRQVDYPDAFEDVVDAAVDAAAEWVRWLSDLDPSEFDEDDRLPVEPSAAEGEEIDIIDGLDTMLRYIVGRFQGLESKVRVFRWPMSQHAAVRRERAERRASAEAEAAEAYDDEKYERSSWLETPSVAQIFADL